MASLHPALRGVAFDVRRDLDRFGPDAPRESGGPGPAPAAPLPALAAREYCRRLARRHYENFTVASRLLPARWRQPFSDVYAYCRWADDLADETGDPAESLRLLDWWEHGLRECYRGRATHPVFVALMETIEEHQLPPEPFHDLLSAFRQDQRKTRYDAWEELFDYCRRSANPVGRIVLRLARADGAENIRRSDAICTGLQLANFCQDVARDFDRGRIYLPREAWRAAGVREGDFDARRISEPFRALLADAVDRAERLFDEGAGLPEAVAREFRLPLRLFPAGGRAILAAIRRRRYDVWSKRPTVGKVTKLRLVVGAWLSG